MYYWNRGFPEPAAFYPSETLTILAARARLRIKPTILIHFAFIMIKFPIVVFLPKPYRSDYNRFLSFSMFPTVRVSHQRVT